MKYVFIHIIELNRGAVYAILLCVFTSGIERRRVICYGRIKLMEEFLIGILTCFANEVTSFVTEERLSKIKEIFNNKNRVKNIEETIKKQLSIEQYKFKTADVDYDFDSLCGFVKEFSKESFIKEYVICFSDPVVLDKAESKICQFCINNTNAKNQEAEDKVKAFLNKCFSIVENSLKSELSEIGTEEKDV